MALKKIISALLTLLTILCLGANAFAANDQCETQVISTGTTYAENVQPRASYVFDGVNLYLDDELYACTVFLTGFGSGEMTLVLEKKGLFGWSGYKHMKKSFTDVTEAYLSVYHHAEPGTYRVRVDVEAEVNGIVDSRTYRSSSSFEIL